MNFIFHKIKKSAIKNCRDFISLILILCIMGALTACGGKGSNYGLDKDRPREISIWYTFNSKRSAALEKMIEEFNSTEGKDRGIVVKCTSFDSDKKLRESFEETAAEDRPNMLGISSECPLLYDSNVKYVDINSLIAANVKETIDEEYINKGSLNNQWIMFPIVKDTEVLAADLGQWQPFMQEEEHYLGSLSSWESMAIVGEDYYAYSGKGILALRSEADYMLIGSHQLGTDILNVEGNSTIFRADGKVMKTLWDNYYVPMVKGAYYKYNQNSMTDLLEQRVAIASIRSSSVGELGTATATEGDAFVMGVYEILPYPQFKGAESICAVDDTGVAIIDKNEVENFASMLFLEWLSGSEVNLRFACMSGGLPINKLVSDMESLEKIIEKNTVPMSPLEISAMRVIMESLEDGRLYMPQLTPHYGELRKILAGCMSNEGINDHYDMEEKIYIGIKKKEAIEDYISDDHFSVFLDDLKKKFPEP